ncbi:unnamed protein product [Schistocephalus solidus]|uniref:DUF937 domain-containing protein n=1 Tax=Schistocephalus solidus TaxID=70667 RepID=A0A183SFM1_SCHSO|nr:unnamed protein product [Schistocephalus solidus]
MSDNLPQVSRDSDYSVRTRLRTLFETSGSGMRGLEGIIEAFEDDEEALSTILDAVRGEENGVRNLLATLEGKDESLVSDLISRFSGDVDGLRDLILTGMHPDQTQNTGDADQTLQHNLQADYSMKGAIQSSSDADDAGNQDHKEVENVPKVAPTGLPDVIGGIAESAIGGDILSAAALLMTTDAIADDNKGGLANLRKAFRSGADAKDLLSEVSAYVGENSDVAVRSLLNLVGGPNVDSFFQLLDTSSQPSVFFQQVLNMLGSGVGAVNLEKLLKMLSGGNQLSVPVISSLLERFGLEELLSVLRDNDPSGRDPMAALVAAVGGGANFSRLLDSLGGGREAALERLIAVSGGGEAGLRSLIAAVGDTESLVAGCGDDGASALEMLIRVAGGGEIGMSNLLAAAHSSDADPLGAFIHLLGGGETGLQRLIEIAGGGEAGLTAIINVAGAHHGAKGQDRREAGLLKLVRSLCAGDKVLDVLLNAVAASAGEQTDAPTTALVSLVNAVGGGRNGLRRLLKTAGGAGQDPAGGRRTRNIQRLVMAAGGTSEALNVLGTLAGGGGVGLKTLMSICEPEDEENMQSLFEEVLVAAGLDKNLAEALPSDADGLAEIKPKWKIKQEDLELKFDDKTKEEESQPSTRRPSSACLVALGRGISRTPPWARTTDEDLIARLQCQLKEKLRKERTRQQMELLRLQQAKDRELELQLRKQQQGTAIWERLRIQKQTADSEFRRAMEETQLAAQAEAHKRREAQACKEPTKTAESRQNQQIPMKQMSEEEQMMAYLASSQGLRESTHKMSIVWTLVATFLYAEGAVIILLLLPLISSTRWNSLFKSRLIATFSAYGSFYFRGCICLLTLMICEAARSVWTQNNAYQKLKDNPQDFRAETESVFLMRLFRAQRNLYISGFSLFLWFAVFWINPCIQFCLKFTSNQLIRLVPPLCSVLYRLVQLITEHARLIATSEASLAQAKSASEAASKFLSQDKSAKGESSDKEVALKAEVEKLKKRLEAEEEERKRIETDRDMVKKQADQMSKEYDRVSAECQALQDTIIHYKERLNSILPDLQFTMEEEDVEGRLWFLDVLVWRQPGGNSNNCCNTSEVVYACYTDKLKSTAVRQTGRD